MENGRYVELLGCLVFIVLFLSGYKISGIIIGLLLIGYGEHLTKSEREI